MSGAGLYAYARHNPYVYRDPLGLTPVGIGETAPELVAGLVTDELFGFAEAFEAGPLRGSVRIAERFEAGCGSNPACLSVAADMRGAVTSQAQFFSAATFGILNLVPGVGGGAAAGLRAPGWVARGAPRVATRGAGGLVDDVARAGAGGQPNRIYSARELVRRADEPGPFHNFPGSFDDVIFSQGQRSVTPGFFKQSRPGLSNDSVQFRLPGNINGQQGTFEIFTRPSVSGRTEVIQHRFFRPDR